MAAGTYNFEINQGETLSLGLIFKDSTGTAISLTTATIKAQIRPTASSNTIIASLLATKDSGVAGRVVLSLTAAQTGQLSFTSAVWDCLVTFADGTTLRAVQGAVTLSTQVTR